VFTLYNILIKLKNTLCGRHPILSLEMTDNSDAKIDQPNKGITAFFRTLNISHSAPAFVIGWRFQEKLVIPAFGILNFFAPESCVMLQQSSCEASI
jgi:hypothetical protein